MNRASGYAAFLALLLASEAVHATPICVPAHPLSRAELYGEDGSYEEMSVARLQKLADKGDPMSLNTLGERYGTGTQVKKDSRRSFEYYRRAADLGMPRAQANLAFMYFNGEGTPKDEALAYSWARKSADSGDMQAQDLLGYLLGKGIGTKLDLKEAAFCYLLAARQGSVRSQRTMANLYSMGHGIPADQEQALVWRARARESAVTGKPWFDETPLTEMPAEWTPPYELVDEISAESEVRTPNYSFRVTSPTEALAKLPWTRYSGTTEPRNTALQIGLQGYDTYGVFVEARGKPLVGETMVIAAERVRPGLKFRVDPNRPDCVSMDLGTPFVTGEIAGFSAFCQNPKSLELFEIGVSRKSLTFRAKGTPDTGDIEKLAAEMKAVLTSFRFE